MTDFLYPSSPIDVDEKKLAPSLSFRKQAMNVVGSIILFFIVYILLVLAAIGLAIVCFYGGGMLILAIHNFFSLILGVGLMGVGVSVIFFLIKFIFAVSKDENPSSIEISESDQPHLFAFVRQLSRETATTFPKKIYLSPDVNARVFYNSNFWSMFLPVRKNLEIGLGLINSVNISEFKAVIAHEFGHFSQRSMKLGSFTYQVNRIIYNMLYDNKGYTDFLNSWGRVHRYLVIFATISAKITNSIQWVLRGMYRFINKSYMGLSREMEFHADSIAASVAGGNNLISSLSRMEIAEGCYQTALDYANDWLKENRIAQNIFANQLSILSMWSKEEELPLKEGLPQISFEFISSHSRSRINYKNQWASHPTLQERKAHLDQLSMNTLPDNTRAWQLFSESNKLQEVMTKKLYQHVKIEGKTEICDSDFFVQWYAKEKADYALPPQYNGFYSKRYINVSDWVIEDLKNIPAAKSFEELFNKENGWIQSSINNNRNDLSLIKAIQSKDVNVKTFDFDGSRHSTKDCDKVVAKLEEDIASEIELQKSLDKEAFVFFFQHAKERASDVQQGYEQFQSISRNYEEYIEIADEVLKTIQPFYEGGMTHDQITSRVAELKSNSENKLKKIFAELLQENLIINDQLNAELQQKIKNFIGKSYFYFVANEFQNHELNELRELTIKTANEFGEYKFKNYKKLLEDQLEYCQTGK